MGDARLKHIPTKQWTTVFCDEVLFADLLMTYFAIEHSFFAVFDKDLFLDDLVAVRSRFYSSLLVNAILSLACLSNPCLAEDVVQPSADVAVKHYATQIEHRGQPWNDRNLGSHFLRETRRLWQVEEGKASLTTIQAALFICYSLNIDGEDKVGWTFVSQAVPMSQDLGLFATSPLVKVNSTERDSSNPWNHARTVTAWAVFMYETCVNLGHSVQRIVKVNEKKVCYRIILACYLFSNKGLPFLYHIKIIGEWKPNRFLRKMVKRLPTFLPTTSTRCRKQIVNCS